jgi:hypothetical protein
MEKLKSYEPSYQIIPTGQKTPDLNHILRISLGTIITSNLLCKRISNLLY